MLRDLYGGAIVASIPGRFQDVSNLRQVPDHQEVFMDTSSDNPNSLIVELLDFDSSINCSTAIQHHFQDLANCNESSNTTVIATEVHAKDSSKISFIPRISDGVSEKAVLIGKQSASKYHRRHDDAAQTQPEEDVYILLVLVRLLKVRTDLLISLNMPASIGGAGIDSNSLEATIVHSLNRILIGTSSGSSVGATAAGLAASRPPTEMEVDKGAGAESQSVLNTGSEVLPPSMEAALQALQDFLHSLEVRDWTLFVN